MLWYDKDYIEDENIRGGGYKIQSAQTPMWRHKHPYIFLKRKVG
jgi:hypothetical protein